MMVVSTKPRRYPVTAFFEFSSEKMMFSYCRAACGELNAHARLTWQIARAIRAAAAEGVTMRDIARRFGVNSGTVFKIVNNQQWIE